MLLKKIILILLLFMSGKVSAQIPVEIFGGNERSTFDMMYFKYTKKRSGDNSRFLFFNRNRASVDYRMTSSEYLPSFGITGAISYNAPSLKGMAPVIVAQIFNRSVLLKAGVQYAYQKKRLTVFSWLVAETVSEPKVDFFILGRYTPKLTEKTDLFLQVETINAFATSSGKENSFVQRIRVGLKFNYWQFGAGIDLSQIGRKEFATHSNAGVFLRHEF
jgi:hypothetical protein